MADDGVTLSVEVRGAKEIGRALVNLQLKMGDLRSALDEIGSMIVASTQQRFIEGRDPDGMPWKPSHRATSENGQTLVLGGYLRDSIVHAVGRDSVEIGTNLIYARIHQFGGTIRAKSGKNLRFKVGNRWVSKPEVTIPARPFLGLSEADAAEIHTIIKDYIEEALA